MLKNNFFALIFLFSAVTVSWSQIPGYMGKKISLTYDLNFFPYLNLLINDKIPDLFTFATKHQAECNVAIGRKVAFGVSYSVCRQYYAFPELSSVTDFETGKKYDLFTPFPSSQPIKADYLDFSLYFFQKSYIAPVGLYYLIRYGQMQYGLSEDGIAGYGNNVYSYGGSSSYSISLKPSKKIFKGNKFSFGIGNKKIFGNRFFTNLGIRYNVYWGEDLKKINNERDPNINNIDVLLRRFVRAYNRIDITVGTGILLF